MLSVGQQPTKVFLVLHYSYRLDGVNWRESFFLNQSCLTFLSVLSTITAQLITILGVSATPLILLLTNQVFRTRGLAGLPDEELENYLWDMCFHTIYSQIQRDIHQSVMSLYGDHFHLPPGLTFSQLSMAIHNNSRSLVLPIYRNLSELGPQSPEIQQIVEIIQTFI